MITIGALGKEFITWTKDGRRAHIFNPSAFGLSVASMFLIVTSNTDISWGKAISETITYPEHIYLWIIFTGFGRTVFFPCNFSNAFSSSNFICKCSCLS